VIVLPSGFGPANPPSTPLPLVISPHGRNNVAWSNVVTYWQDLPADGPFALVSPDGLGRAHTKASDPFDQPPSNPGLFTYGYPREIADLARMPKIVQETLPWLRVDLERVYVLGSSMGGQETLLLAARFPHALGGGTGRLAGAAAFDSICDLATQCGYLTHTPAGAATAALMLEEVGSRPNDVSGFDQAALFYDRKTKTHTTIGQLLRDLPRDQAQWDERSPLRFAAQLAALGFPLALYWSTKDAVVGNQATKQTGKLYNAIEAANPEAAVAQVVGDWTHSAEFVPRGRLGEALRNFGLIT
jgi:pimeloyl-ACP methyl ester carboxylesterase